MPLPNLLKSKAGITLITTVAFSIFAVTCLICGVATSPYFHMIGCTSNKDLTPSHVPPYCQFSEHLCNLLRNRDVKLTHILNATELKKYTQTHGFAPDGIPLCPFTGLVLASVIASGLGCLTIIAMLILTIIKPTGKISSIVLWISGGILILVVILLVVFFILVGLSHFPCQRVRANDVYYVPILNSCTKERNRVYKLVPLILGTVLLAVAGVTGVMAGFFLRKYPRRVIFMGDDRHSSEDDHSRGSHSFWHPLKKRGSVRATPEEEEAHRNKMIIAQGRRQSTESRKSVTAVGGKKSIGGGKEDDQMSLFEEMMAKRKRSRNLKKSLESLAYGNELHNEEEDENKSTRTVKTKKKKFKVGAAAKKKKSLT